MREYGQKHGGLVLVRRVEVEHADKLRVVVGVELLDGDEVLDEGAHHARRVVERARAVPLAEGVERRRLPLEGKRGLLVGGRHEGVEHLEHARAQPLVRAAEQRAERLARRLRQLGTGTRHELLELGVHHARVREDGAEQLEHLGQGEA